MNTHPRRALPVVLILFVLTALVASPDALPASASAATSQPGCVPPPSGLTGWWTGDGDAGNLVGGPAGTLNSGATFTSGRVGQAFGLDGINDYVGLAGTFGGGPEATIEAWVRTTGTTGDFQAVVSSTNESFAHLQLNSGGNIVAYGDFQVPAWKVTMPIVSQSPTGVWRHLAFSIRSGASRLYVDGVLVGSSTETFTNITPSSSIRIGSGYAGGRFFRGAVDEASIYNRALTAAEIQAVHGAGSAGKCRPDDTEPVITGTRSPAANAHGWNNTDVTVSFTCADEVGGSGIATDTVGGDVLSGEGADQSVTNTGACVDAAGNVADAVTVGDIHIDRTDPTLAPGVPATILQGASVTATPGAADALSGLASAGCTPVDTSTTGPHTGSCTATDRAGNTASATFEYLVYALAPGGGAFVVGDETATGDVLFWGSQWARANDLSGGSAPAALKGFAAAPAAPACGTGWQTAPGASAPPPAGPLPDHLAVIVTSRATKSGSRISGDTAHVVVIRTDAGYGSDPGQAGTGTVVATIC